MRLVAATGGMARPAEALSGFRPAWWRLLSAFLGVMWVVHGLEKIGMNWPGLLAGHTADVPGLLRIVALQSPFAWMRGLAAALVPAGPGLRWAILALELAMAAVLLAAALAPAGWPSGAMARRLAPAAALGGALFHGALWLGFWGLEWPPAYPIVLAAHAAVGVAGAWPRHAGAALAGLRVLAALLWLYELAAGRALPAVALPVGIALALGLLVRGAAAAGLLAVALAAGAGHWGMGPWAYYTVGAVLLALLLGDAGRTAGADRLWR